jgi:hypothetical protein
MTYSQKAQAIPILPLEWANRADLRVKICSSIKYDNVIYNLGGILIRWKTNDLFNKSY